jgi:hypothetical protein
MHRWHDGEGRPGSSPAPQRELADALHGAPYLVALLRTQKVPVLEARSARHDWRRLRLVSTAVCRAVDAGITSATATSGLDTVVRCLSKTPNLIRLRLHGLCGTGLEALLLRLAGAGTIIARVQELHVRGPVAVPGVLGGGLCELLRSLAHLPILQVRARERPACNLACSLVCLAGGGWKADDTKPQSDLMLSPYIKPHLHLNLTPST